MDPLGPNGYYQSYSYNSPRVILKDTVIGLVTSIFALSTAKVVERNMPNLSAVLLAVPAIAAIVWIFRRCVSGDHFNNHSGPVVHQPWYDRFNPISTSFSSNLSSAVYNSTSVMQALPNSRFSTSSAPPAYFPSRSTTYSSNPPISSASYNSSSTMNTLPNSRFSRSSVSPAYLPEGSTTYSTSNPPISSASYNSGSTMNTLPNARS